MDGVIGKVEQTHSRVSKLEKLTLPLFVLSFFLSANKPVFLLLISAFVLLLTGRLCYQKLSGR